MAIFGVVAVISVVFLPSLLGDNPSVDSPTSTGPTLASALATEITDAVALPSETKEPAPQSVSGAESDDVFDNRGVSMRFIPAGEFEMGSNTSAHGEEQPAHTVYLDDFYIDKYEVTNAHYRSCVDAGICQPPAKTGSVTRSDYFENPDYADYPVVFVDWDMAVTYCEEWRGGRLPTEAQWEKAARGSDGRSYPWGEVIDATLANYNYAAGETTAVGSYEDGQSPYGVFDMSGNVWEWVSDWYDEGYYGTLGERTENPAGPSGGQFHVLRGGSWVNEQDFVRTFTRGWNELLYFGEYTDFGFRCARDTAP